jgi:hypothetical protein
MRPIRRCCIWLGGAVVLVTGCKPLGMAAYLLSPRQTQKAEYKLPEGTLAVVIENTRPQEESPVFDRALYDKLAEVFRDQKVKSALTPFDAVADLRRAHADFNTWSIQRVGRELKADQVLYVQIQRLVFRERPDHPVLTPAVSVRVKLIGVERAAGDARVWPKGEEDGRTITVTRPTEEAGGAEAIDVAATKLARDTGQKIAEFFYDVDLEQKPQPEH